MPFALNILMSLFTTHSKVRGYTLDIVTDALLLFRMYYLVLGKRPSPAYQFSEIFTTPTDLIWTPHLLIWQNFCFSNCKIFKSILSLRGILTNFSVPEFY